MYFLTQGPKVKEFEKAFAEYIGSKYAVSVSNGTAALHLSIMGLGLKPNQKVITSPITFAATANAILYNQGQVDFCDIDKETLLLDINLVREKLKRAEKHTYGGIIPVDFAGAPVQMEQFRELADEFDLWLLEDACHAPGGYFRNKEGQQSFCGDGSNADAAIFSFHPVKHITSGEGGMITTNNSKLYERLLRLRSHGITKSSHELNENHGGFTFSLISSLNSLTVRKLSFCSELYLKFSGTFSPLCTSMYFSKSQTGCCGKIT